MASMTPVLTREQQRLIKSGDLTDKQIERMRNSATTWKFEQPAGKDRDGKRIRHTETFHGTKSEAKKALVKFEAYWGSRKVKDRTLGGYIEEYLERKRGTIAESSYYTTTRKMETIKYMWGKDTKLSELTPALIDDTLDEMRTKGAIKKVPCKAAYVATIRSTLHTLLDDAVKHGALVSNPIALTKNKYRAKAERREIPPTDALLAVMRELDVRHPCEMAIMLALTCGLRRQECAALRFEDIDFDAGILHVHRSVKEDGYGEWVEEYTKTEAGMRDLPMPDFLPGMLEKRRQTIEEDIAVALRSGKITERPEELYVCANKLGGRTKLSVITHYWTKRRKGWGVSCRFHDLRHCYISCLSQADPPVAVITAAALAGHSDPRMTLSVYSHSSFDKVIEAVESVSKLFEGGLVPYEPPDGE